MIRAPHKLSEQEVRDLLLRQQVVHKTSSTNTSTGGLFSSTTQKIKGARGSSPSNLPAPTSAPYQPSTMKSSSGHNRFMTPPASHTGDKENRIESNKNYLRYPVTSNSSVSYNKANHTIGNSHSHSHPPGTGGRGSDVAEGPRTVLTPQIRNQQHNYLGHSQPARLTKSQVSPPRARPLLLHISKDAEDELFASMSCTLPQRVERHTRQLECLCASLQESLSHTQATLGERKRNADAMRARIQAKEDEIAHLEHDVSELEVQREEREKKAMCSAHLNETLAKQQRDHLERARARHVEAREQLQKAHAEHEHVTQMIHLEESSLQSELDSVTSHVTEVRYRTQLLANDLDAKECALKTLHTVRQQSIEEEIKHFTQDRQQRIAEIREQFARKEQELCALMDEKILVLREQCVRLDGDVNAILEDRRLLEVKEMELRAQLSASMDEPDNDGTTTVAVLTHELSEREQEVSQKEADAQRHHMMFLQLNDVLEQRQASLTLRERCSDGAHHIREQLEQLENEFMDLTQQDHACRQRIERYKEEVEDREEESMRKLNEVRDRIEASHRRREEMLALRQAKSNAIRAKIRDVMEEVLEKEQELRRVEERVKEKEQELAELHAQNEILESNRRQKASEAMHLLQAALQQSIQTLP